MQQLQINKELKLKIVSLNSNIIHDICYYCLIFKSIIIFYIKNDIK
jgi:hypothetical protein